MKTRRSLCERPSSLQGYGFVLAIGLELFRRSFAPEPVGC